MMKGERADKVIQIFVTATDYQALREYAVADERSVSQFTRRIISQFLKNKQKESTNYE